MENDLCDNCQKNKAEELHTCPYAKEIHDNYELKCNCCPECRQGCLWDI